MFNKKSYRKVGVANFQVDMSRFLSCLSLITVLMLLPTGLIAQDEGTEGPDNRPVRSTFESALLIDNQTVMVPIKGTFEFDIQHRFGTFENGYSDFFGLYANSNIRLGLSYVPIENLVVGVGATKFKSYVDFYAKYAVLKQSRSGKIPVSVSVLASAGFDARKQESENELFFNKSDRLSFFYQVLIARKFTDWLSVQVAPSMSHFNIVDKNMKNDHFAIAFGGRIKVASATAIIVGVDQPLTKHTLNNPNPNLSIGVEMSTSSHAFQIFIGNYNKIIAQENNMFNSNNYEEGFKQGFLLGFNITRLWNF